jgi:5'-3' exonuclease
MGYVALDFMSLVHPFAAKMGELEPQMIPVFCRQWVHYFGNPHIYIPTKNPIGFDLFTARPLLLVDSKLKGKYWRHDYHPEYKTGRSPKSALLMQVRDLLLNYWIDQGLPVFSQDGFEADDWAGALVKYTKPEDKIALVSVDSDWAQLVSDRVMWLDVFPPSRRKELHQKKSVLGPVEVLERFNNQAAFKRTRLLNTPFDLVDYKHEFGDKSDRIPPGRLVQKGIIDLLNPIREPDQVQQIIEGLDKDGVSVQIKPPKLDQHHMYAVPCWINDEYSQVGDLTYDT